MHNKIRKAARRLRRTFKRWGVAAWADLRYRLRWVLFQESKIKKDAEILILEIEDHLKAARWR